MIRIRTLHAMLDWRSFPWYPFLGVVAAVLAAYTDTYAPAAWLVRPLLIGLAGVAALVLLSLVLVRRWDLAGMMAALALIAPWQPLLAVFLAATASLILLVHYMRRRAVPSLAGPTRSLNVLALLLIAVAAVPVGPLVARSGPIIQTVALSQAAATPNIYLVMLDGYPRADTLAGWGFDNSPFLEELQGLGFRVEPDAESSYRMTTQTLASMLAMRPLSELDIEIPESGIEQRRLMRSIIASMPAADELRRVGYEIVTSASPAAETALVEADRYLDGGQPNEFEQHLLQLSGVQTLIDMVDSEAVYDWRAGRIESNFAHLHALAEEDVGRRLVFAHILAPHAPYIYAADGSRIESPRCRVQYCGSGLGDLHDFDVTLEEFVPIYTGNLRHINALALDAVRHIVREDPTSVVIVFSDHGSRIDARDPDEWYRTLFAARTPGAPNLYADHGGPAGIFHGLYRAYFGVEVEWPERVRYGSTDENALVTWPLP